MRYRIKEYSIGGDTDFSIAGKVSIEDIRLIVNETQKKVICSSMNKSNVACNYVEDMDVTFITFSRSICELQLTDQLTIEIDKGDDLTSVESKVEEESQAIQGKIANIDLTPIENKVDEGVSALSTKIDNIDLSSVAKQGENKNATNSKILEEIGNVATVLTAINDTLGTL